jgi:hypothetical protein
MLGDRARVGDPAFSRAEAAQMPKERVFSDLFTFHQSMYLAPE